MPFIPRNSRKPWQPERKAFTKAVDNPFYHSTVWRKFRKQFLTANPLCQHCNNHGIITQATTVDHIVSINPVNGFDTADGRFPNPLDPDNCQSLCFRCHASKSGKTR